MKRKGIDSLSKRMIRTLSIIAFIVSSNLGLSQDFFDGTYTYKLEKGKIFEYRAFVAYSYHGHSRQIIVKKTRKVAKESDYIPKQIGDVKILVHPEAIDKWNREEENYIDAVMSIPYKGLNFSSENDLYIKYRDKAIKKLQSTAIIRSLSQHSSGILVEMTGGLYRRTAGQIYPREHTLIEVSFKKHRIEPEDKFFVKKIKDLRSDTVNTGIVQKSMLNRPVTSRLKGGLRKVVKTYFENKNPGKLGMPIELEILEFQIWEKTEMFTEHGYCVLVMDALYEHLGQKILLDRVVASIKGSKLDVTGTHDKRILEALDNISVQLNEAFIETF